jgi:hypothetical protein
MQGSGSTCRALMKLLLRSMDASSTVVGPTPATPLQLPPAAGPWRAACIPPLPFAPAGGRASGEGGTARSEEGKSSKRSTGESGVKGKGCLANRRQLSAAYSTAHHHRSLLDSILARARIPCGRWCAEEEEGPCLCWRWSAEEDGSGAGRATAAVG